MLNHKLCTTLSEDLKKLIVSVKINIMITTMKMNPSTVQDFIEHYNNLTIKSVMLLKYVFRLDILPTFIIKVSKSFHKKYVDKIFPILKPPPPPCKLNLNRYTSRKQLAQSLLPSMQGFHSSKSHIFCTHI